MLILVLNRVNIKQIMSYGRTSRIVNKYRDITGVDGVHLVQSLPAGLLSLTTKCFVFKYMLHVFVHVCAV